MTEPSFRPVVYVKATCPHCLKLRLFILEAGLTPRIAVRSFTPGDDAEGTIRAELAPHLDTVTFPAAEIATGVYLRESDEIIARLAGRYVIDVDTLPVFVSYARSVLPRYLAVRRENRELRDAMAAE